MTFTPTASMFSGGKLVVNYGTRRRATFTIINENFPGLNMLATINKITVLLETLDTTGASLTKKITSPIIGVGTSLIQVTTTVSTNRGKQLSKDNMETCVVNLLE